MRADAGYGLPDRRWRAMAKIRFIRLQAEMIS
ncbi:hypothetical protein ACVW16_004424 [Bradyrhizobium sp. USDA 4474]